MDWVKGSTFNSRLINTHSNLNKDHSYSKEILKIAGPEIAASKSIISGSGRKVYSKPISYFHHPITPSPTGLNGLSRRWGDVEIGVKSEVVRIILDKSRDLSLVDRAIVLAIAKHESGFNPDAAATTTSAAGIFQIVNATAESLGLKKGEQFDAYKNIEAGIKLYKQHLSLLPTRLKDNDKAAHMYRLHHDGPNHDYGGLKIGYEKVVPIFAILKSQLLY